MQQVQFVYLTQSDYNKLSNKQNGKLYFTSDTKRIYRGSTLFADGVSVAAISGMQTSIQSNSANIVNAQTSIQSLQDQINALNVDTSDDSGTKVEQTYWDGSGNAVWTGTSKQYTVNMVDLSTYMTMVDTSSPLLKTDGEIYIPYFSQLDAYGKTITTVADPTYDGDAANKHYVDVETSMISWFTQHIAYNGTSSSTSNGVKVTCSLSSDKAPTISVAVTAGAIAAGNTSLVTGGTVYTSLSSKASIGTSTDTSYGVGVTYSLYSNKAPTIDVNVTPGQIVSGNTSVVTGGTVYQSINALSTTVNSLSARVTNNYTTITAQISDLYSKIDADTSDSKSGGTPIEQNDMTSYGNLGVVSNKLTINTIPFSDWVSWCTTNPTAAYGTLGQVYIPTFNHLDAGGMYIENVSAPWLSSQAANKDYVDGNVEPMEFGNLLQYVNDIGSAATTIQLYEYVTFYKATISTSKELKIALPLSKSSNWMNNRAPHVLQETLLRNYIITFEIELNITASGLSVNVPWTWIDELLAPDLTQAGCYTIAVRGKYRSGTGWVWRANIQDTEDAY